jgi:hypothetical protein
VNDDAVAHQLMAWASRCESWQGTAHDFILAANYLIDWHDPPCSPNAPADLSLSSGGSNIPMMVLYAAAVENLLRALRVAKHGPPPFDAGGKISGEFANHNLVHHAERAGLALADDEKKLLEQLRAFAEAGRHPVARIPGTQTDALQLEYPRDVQRVWAMLERLEVVLHETGTPCLPTVEVRARRRPPGYEVERGV